MVDVVEEQIANKDKFDYVIFTDECSVQLHVDVHRKQQPQKLKALPKHPPKVRVRPLCRDPECYSLG